MLVSDIIAALEEIAPPAFAAEWDNVGLLAGSRGWTADKALLTIDLTTPVVHEAIDAGAKLIVSYHPPIFHPVKSITDATEQGKAVVTALRRGVAIYS